MDKKYFLPLGLVVLALLAIADFYTVQWETKHKAGLAFSNTMSWEPALLTLEAQPTHYPPQTYAGITLPPFPTNTSQETVKELATLHSYESLRTPQELADINAQADINNIRMGSSTLGDYLDAKKYPATAALLSDSFKDVTIITLQQKKLFDRVRASKLDPTLTTAIPIPGHPSYPSGHSTQMHFLAYVLGELAPSQRDVFIAEADQIAKNREIAGLHYPSDTRAGVLLAQQLFAALMKNPEFTAKLVAAKKEWATK